MFLDDIATQASMIRFDEMHIRKGDLGPGVKAVKRYMDVENILKKMGV